MGRLLFCSSRASWGAAMIRVLLTLIVATFLGAQTLPYQPNYDRCAGIYFSTNSDAQNGPCWGGTSTGNCNETRTYTAYLKDPSGHVLQSSSPIAVTAYGNSANLYVNPTTDQRWQCPPLWQAVGGTYPIDTTRWEFLAIGSDRIAEHGTSGNSCYSTSSF